MASSINPLTSSASGVNTRPTAPAGLGGAAPSEEVFLQLLVAQMQNQDPLNPADSTAFVSELAQFSQLEQVIAIRADIENQAATAATATQQAANSGQGSTTNVAQAGRTTGTVQTQS